MARALPLIGLRAFVEFGRRGSVKEAAAALNVTPGAVSQQLRVVEDQLGASLIERRNREVRFTPTGWRLYEPLLSAFQAIEDAVEPFHLVRPPHRNLQTLTITTSESFAATWLIPRLSRFSEAHPNIEVRVETSPNIVDLRRETHVDLAIRHGLGDYPGLEAVRIMTPRLIPVCSPALLETRRPPRSPADCLEFPLLQDHDRADWLLWFRAHGIRDERAARGSSFSSDYLLMRAAVAGQGIALVRDTYAGEELDKGTLVIALDRPWPTSFAYYLVARPEVMYRPKIRAFREWIMDEVEKSDPQPVPQTAR